MRDTFESFVAIWRRGELGRGRYEYTIIPIFELVYFQVYLIARSTVWVLPKHGNSGYPMDISLTRLNNWFYQHLPLSFLNFMTAKYIEQRFSHSLYSIEPEKGPLSNHPSMYEYVTWSTHTLT